MNNADIQRALLRAGFDPKGIDGIWGRYSIAAAKAFQKSRGLVADGIVGPKTLALLFPGAASPTVAEPPWYAEGLRKKGLHEVNNNSLLRKWLASDGKTLGDPAKLPWCGDYVETCIALTLPKEPMVANPYLARNWVKFGVRLSKGAIGAVLAFERPGGGGHVGFYAGEDKDYFSVLGGNQSNAVTIARILKKRLLPNGMRWPSSYPLPTSGPVASVGGAISTNEA